MDTFFQKLRDIQKKERNTGTLSEIDDTFYDDASKYLQELLTIVNENPLSLEAYQLRDAQRITIEICEKREFKIISTAVANVQKAHDIFKGHKRNSDLYDVVPYNTTPEEEKLYKDIINTIISHREYLMKEIVSAPNTNETKVGFKPRPADKIHDLDSKIPSKEPVSESQREFDFKDVETKSKPQKSQKPKLDASQIEMMFGQAPDDILLDENNNPIVSKNKHDVTTPFKPPVVPKEDTVSLQNNKNFEESADKESVETEITRNDESEEEKTVGDVLEESSKDSIGEPESQDVPVSDTDVLDNSEVTEIDNMPSELMVVFNKEVSTDVLDENEKTYGPFDVEDVALLPGAMVKILKDNDVISLL